MYKPKTAVADFLNEFCSICKIYRMFRILFLAILKMNISKNSILQILQIW